MRLGYRKMDFAQGITGSIGCVKGLLAGFLLARPILLIFSSLEPGF